MIEQKNKTIWLNFDYYIMEYYDKKDNKFYPMKSTNLFDNLCADKNLWKNYFY